MAISITSPQAQVGYIINATSADASGTETLLAGTSGQRIKIRHISMHNLTVGALSFTLSGAAALIGPVSIGANSSLRWDFNPAMVLAYGQDLEITADAGNILVFVQGAVN